MKDSHKNELFLDKTDEDLVRMTLDDQNCFLYIMKRYEGKLMAYITRISGFSKEDAEDVLQEVFIKAYVNLNSFNDNLKFSSWIYRIAHNETINSYRKKKSRPSIMTDLDDTFLNNVASDMKTDGDVDVEYLRNNINKILDNLDVKYREILILRFWEDKNYKEISDILKKPMGTVATLVSRAKKAFREEIEKSESNFI